jgi:hypothetical protein
MEKTIELEDVYKEILALKNEINNIKVNIITEDEIMTEEEEERYKESLKELNEGKTTSLEDLKTELGI